MYRFPDHINIGILFCYLVHQIQGDLKIVADCGKAADVGDPVLLTCSIYGTLTYGITWKRGKTEVATCYQDRKCKSEDPSLYRVGDNHHPSNMQQVTIINATDSDFHSRFTCCHGMNCDESSPCRLQRKTWATAEADCGERAILGQSTVLRCMVSSKIHNGIQWYRNQVPIVQCDTQKNCKSLEDRFEVFKRHDDKNQQVIIKNVSTDDFSSQFTCVDNSLIPPTLPSDSTCRLTQYYETSTTVNCGHEVKLGDTVEMSCTVLGDLAYGVTWFRGGHGIIRCSQSYECYSSDLSRYSYSIDGNTVRLIVRNVSMDDLNKPFSCQDSPELPLVVQTESTCNLNLVTSTAKTPILHHTSGIVLVGAVVLFQL